MVTCIACRNAFNHYSFFYQISKDFIICTQCFNSFPIIHKSFKFNDIDVYCIYAYRTPINSYLMDLKMKGDIAIAKIFLNPFKNLIEVKYKGYIILPIPSTKSSDKKRGYNHVKEISKTLNLKMEDVFYKSKDYKQTSQKLEERKKVSNIIKMNKNLDKGKKYLLLDDVITSGSTLKSCIELLKKQGIKKIKALIVCDNYRKR